MQKKWLNYLVDPEDKNPLELVNIKSDGTDIIDGELISKDGSRKYPIVNGILRFIPQEIYDRTQSISSDTTQTGRSFGDKWSKERTIRLGQSDEEKKAHGEHRKEQFFAMLGVNTDKELEDLFKDGMNCLDAGCGVAWSEYSFNINNNVNRFAIDLSSSVEVAYHRTRHLENVCVAEANLLKLPFKRKFFDIIFSNGVIHHTPDAEKAFHTLCDHLKPGGIIGIYIYCVKPFLRELADEKIREITTRMDFGECMEFSGQMAKLGNLFQNYKEPLIIEDDIPLLGITAGRYDLQKFLYDHFLKCFYNDKLGYDVSALTNVDWYHPKFASHHTRNEVASWFDDNDIVDVRFIQPKGWEYSGFFVSGRKSL